MYLSGNSTTMCTHKHVLQIQNNQTKLSGYSYPVFDGFLVFGVIHPPQQQVVLYIS